VSTEDDAPHPNLPTERQAARMRVPEPRHRAARVGRRSQPHGELNTVAMPWVDFGQDLADILAGHAMRDGNRFVVNNREYILEGGGRLCPVSGDGLIRLSRAAYSALGLYNFGGVTAATEAQLDRVKVDESAREQARRVWRALQVWRERQA
jgi:hypothetical protein